MKKLNTNKYAVFPTVALVTLLVDLFSKYYILKANLGEINIIKGFFKITMHANDGVAFGVFLGYTMQLIISVSIIILLTYFCFKYFCGKNQFYSQVLFGIIVGGALGNLINRIHLGYVIDFIYLRPIPVFNIADIGITLGLIALLILNWNQG